MARDIRFLERRQFGRRRTLWHAWVKVAGRGREPCIVRNFSEAGALLEFDGPVPVAGHLILTIEPFGFEVACHVRHRSRTGLGVNLDDSADGDIWTRRVSAADIVARMRRELETRR